ncbi:protein UmuD [Pseudomonas syringae pv. syringae str. B301D-R]|nr:SOS-response transcriptional repressors (RecA-mediated autopeptidases) [Pseudomonas syringae pv. syringae B301D]EXL31509.1 protein UmuD [Pseudomonas syringae pv. syringae str. B301D-R]
MQGIGIFDGDLIVVDRSLTAVHGSIVIASVNGEPLCKRLTIQGQSVVLISENPGYAPRYILEGEELVIFWGGQAWRAYLRPHLLTMSSL